MITDAQVGAALTAWSDARIHRFADEHTAMHAALAAAQARAPELQYKGGFEEGVAIGAKALRDFPEPSASEPAGAKYIGRIPCSLGPECNWPACPQDCRGRPGAVKGIEPAGAPPFCKTCPSPHQCAEEGECIGPRFVEPAGEPSEEDVARAVHSVTLERRLNLFDDDERCIVQALLALLQRNKE